MRNILLISILLQFGVGCGGGEREIFNKAVELPFCAPPDSKVDVALQFPNTAQNQWPQSSISHQTPTELVPRLEWPIISDDLNFVDMDTVINRQLARFEKMPNWISVQLGETKYSLSQLKKSHQRFLSLTKEYRRCMAAGKTDCIDRFQLVFSDEFEMYRPKLDPSDPRFGEEDPTLFTAYYTPTILGSKTKTEEYKYAVYKRPNANDQKRFTRVDIDFNGSLERQNLELFYTKDLFALYLMHVEGGGRVRFEGRPPREDYYLSYDGTNAKKWRFISQYMLENELIADTSIDSQREYLERHPERQSEIYSSCPSYVYFKKSASEPMGSDSVSLTNNRSIATDDDYYKFKGLLAFVVANRPDVPDENPKCKQIPFKSFSRFFLDQDTGGAIVGKSRVDIFFGEGRYAELAAHNLVQRGNLYFAVLKTTTHE